MTTHPISERELTEPVELAGKLHWRLFRITAALRRVECDPTNRSELTLTQCSLLYLLVGTDRIKMTDLSAFEGVALPTMSKAVMRLEELGMVRRFRLQADQRNVWVSITPKGEQTQRSAIAQLTEAMQRALTSSEISALDDALEPLERLASQAIGAKSYAAEEIRGSIAEAKSRKLSPAQRPADRAGSRTTAEQKS